MRNAIIKILATFFGVGYFPLMRGTLSALAVFPAYYFIKDNAVVYTVTILLLCITGFFISDKAERIFKRKDASEITIDDACGALIALFLIPQRPLCIITAFILYRVFDIIKVPPARQLEALKGGYGIMLDDIVVGAYANIAVQILHAIL